METDTSLEEDLRSKVDRVLLEEMQVETLRNLNQWDTLQEIANETDNLELKFEAAWQRKDMVQLNALIKEFQQENSFTFLIQGLIKLS